jgi:hypothetical protein
MRRSKRFANASSAAFAIVTSAPASTKLDWSGQLLLAIRASIQQIKNVCFFFQSESHHRRLSQCHFVPFTLSAQSSTAAARKRVPDDSADWQQQRPQQQQPFRTVPATAWATAVQLGHRPSPPAPIGLWHWRWKCGQW